MSVHPVEPASRSTSHSGPDAPLVLIVEDERPQQLVMTSALQRRGYRIELADHGREAIRLAGAIHPDVVLLDLGLPDIDGVELCRHLRRIVDCPILVVSADPVEQRLIDTLDIGADDFIHKPFSVPVLLARLRVALRHRAEMAPLVQSDVIECGDVTIDIAAHQLRIGDEPIDLPARCFALLVLLARNQGQIVTYDTILRSLNGTPSLATQQSALRVLVTRVRTALGTGQHRPTISTQINVGYSLTPPSA